LRALSHRPPIRRYAESSVAISLAACDPTRELVYWRENYKTRPYADKATALDEYEPAYGYGVAAYTKYPGRSFDDVDSDLSRDWNASRGKSTLAWDRARFASRDAWDRDEVPTVLGTFPNVAFSIWFSS
jgi:hypothetical protein